MAFYELIAERLAIPDESDVEESPMDRGTRLEAEAIARYVKETGKKVNTDLVIWSRDDNENIAISPDGSIGKTEAVEVKCLSSAEHLKTFLTQQIPSQYDEQKLQYFIVNDKLKLLHFAFYDPRIPAKDFFTITVKREDVQDQIDQHLTFERETLDEVAAAINQLTF